jgi:cytochrome c-type biogenesis protein CcmH
MKNMNVFRIHTRLILILLCILATLGTLEAQTADKKVREIEDNLIAPCCWSQTVSQHYSEVSEQIRQEVRAMVAAGKSRDEILDYYVAKYGERILATPRAKGFNRMVYILPWAALVLGAWLLIVLLRKQRQPEFAAVPNPPSVSDERYTAIIEKEMKEMDE